MNYDDQLDLGYVQVHTQVLAEIVATTIGTIDGVSTIERDFVSQFFKLFGRKIFPGIDVKIDENKDVTIDVKVNIRYGMNIPDVARLVQDEIKAAIERSVNIYVRDINVNIHGLLES